MTIKARLARIERAFADSPQAQQTTTAYIQQCITALDADKPTLPAIPVAVRAYIARQPDARRQRWKRIAELVAAVNTELA